MNQIMRTTSKKVTASPQIKKRLESDVLRLMKLLDVPGNEIVSKYVDDLADNLEVGDIKKLRATLVTKKLTMKVKSQDFPRFKSTLAHLMRQNIPAVNHFLDLVSSILEDNALLIFINQASSSSTQHSSPQRLHNTSSLINRPGQPSPSPIQNMSDKKDFSTSPIAPRSSNETLVLKRLPAEEELPNLLYGSKIFLRVPSSGLFGAIENQTDEKELPEFITDSKNAIPFRIENGKNRREKGPVRFQDTVVLCNDEGFYLNAEERDRINGHREDSGARIKWTICSAATQAISHYSFSSLDPSQAIGVVKIFDKIALRSCFGTFLMKAGSNVEKDEALGLVKPSQTWNISPSNLPFAPEWLRRRLYMLYKDPPASSDQVNIKHFNSHNKEIQEQLILEDLLYAMMGIEGRWIKKKIGPKEPGVQEFVLSPRIRDKSLVTVVNRIIPICSYFSYIRHYIDVYNRYEYGVVSHAFCSAIRRMLKEYLILIAQLESRFRHNRTLTLMKTWFYIQPCFPTMERLHKICKLATDNIGTKIPAGGQLLNVIYVTMKKEGNEQAQNLYKHLISEAAVPYFAMVESWIYSGLIHDPFNEFEIKSQETLLREKNLFNDTYWDKRYTLDEDKVPRFFTKSLSQKILTTGKYLNVIRECGRSIDCPVEKKLHYSTNETEFVEIIDEAYKFASMKLLNLLLHEKQLLPRLRSIKRYFLIHQGDFLVHFMDIAEDELTKSISHTTSIRLESLLEVALRTSNASSDIYKDDLSCYIDQYTLEQKLEWMRQPLSGGKKRETATYEPLNIMHEKVNTDLPRLEGFTLSYSVRWPLSVIISKGTILQYQCIFRHLFYLKHVERHLSKTWLNHQSTKDLGLRDKFLPSYDLRHRMLHFIQSLTYYLMVEVLEPNWHELERKLKAVGTVDEVLKHHNTFLSKCLKECLLTKCHYILFKPLRKMMKMCLIFANNIERFGNQTSHQIVFERLKGKNIQTKRKELFQRKKTHIKKILEHDNYIQMIKQFTRAFDGKLREFIQKLLQGKKREGDNYIHLGNLAARLDYNGFYSAQFTKTSQSSKR